MYFDILRTFEFFIYRTWSWLVHRAARVVSRDRCPSASFSMMHIYFINIKSQASIMWLEKKKIFHLHKKNFHLLERLANIQAGTDLDHERPEAI